MRRVILSVLPMVLVLAGCGSNGGVRAELDQIQGVWFAITRPEKLPQTDTDTQVGTLLVSLPDQNWQARFAAVSRRGDIVTWESHQRGNAYPKITLTTRRGVVISTRGLGNDLMSSEVSDLQAGLSGRRQSGQREYHFLDGNAEPRNHVFICDYTRQSTVLTEYCHGARLDVVNSYSLGGASGRSQQWLGRFWGRPN